MSAAMATQGPHLDHISGGSRGDQAFDVPQGAVSDGRRSKRKKSMLEHALFLLFSLSDWPTY